MKRLRLPAGAESRRLTAGGRRLIADGFLTYDDSPVNTIDTHAEDWAGFYLANRRTLTVYALSLTGDDAAAQDLIQDVLMSMVRQRRRLDNPRAYVMRCLRNLAYDRRRAGKLPAGDGRAAAEVARSDLSFLDEREVERDESRRQVRAALAALPDDRREVVVLRIYAELTFAEIAETLNRPLGTVTSLYARGIDELRKRMTLNLELPHAAR
jgi:RNA polymerase sigma-70 factor, ECF subfamily